MSHELIFVFIQYLIGYCRKVLQKVGGSKKDKKGVYIWELISMTVCISSLPLKGLTVLLYWSDIG